MRIIEGLRNIQDRSKERKAIEQGYTFFLNEACGVINDGTLYNSDIPHVLLNERAAFKTVDERLKAINIIHINFPGLCPADWLETEKIPNDFDQLPRDKRVEIVTKSKINLIYRVGTQEYRQEQKY